jgi:geranylgeranyl pyrophosphate synthase
VTGQEWLDKVRTQVDREFDRRLPADEAPPVPLYAAIRYALTAPGKRVRPALVLAAARWIHLDPSRVMPAALAVEMIHTYSLIHDDLPAMDDDDLRRGRPTLHRQFSEDIAILVGDALQPMAFATLVECEAEPAALVEAVRLLAGAVGPAGLVGGQVRDMHPARDPGTSPEAALLALHREKTGALITAAAALPAVLAGAADAVAPLQAYGRAVGLAFQITDDILDEAGNQLLMGKATGRDRRQGKATFVSLHGMEKARDAAAREIQVALSQVPGPSADALRALATFVVERDH